MQIAVISDTHGNCFALDRVLQDIRQQGIEDIVCLGDAIQGGAQPAQTVARLRELNCPIVMGNADAWLLTGQETSPLEQTTEQQRVVRAWSLAQLSEDDLAFIRQFSPTITILPGAGQKLLCFHGSPHSFDDIILPTTPDDEVRRLLAGSDATLLTGGHTHTQQLRRISSHAWYFNPGSVSLAYNWTLSTTEPTIDPWSDYAIVSTQGDNFSVAFRHVPFDVDELVRVILSSGRPFAEDAAAVYRQQV